MTRSHDSSGMLLSLTLIFNWLCSGSICRNHGRCEMAGGIKNLQISTKINKCKKWAENVLTFFELTKYGNFWENRQFKFEQKHFRLLFVGKLPLRERKLFHENLESAQNASGRPCYGLTLLTLTPTSQIQSLQQRSLFSDWLKIF